MKFFFSFVISRWRLKKQFYPVTCSFLHFFFFFLIDVTVEIKSDDKNPYLFKNVFFLFTGIRANDWERFIIFLQPNSLRESFQNLFWISNI